MSKKLSAEVVGILSAAVMISFYYTLLALTTGDTLHPYLFFLEKWYLLGPIFIGFGVQMFLFQKLRIINHENHMAMAGTTAGSNGVAMLACCAHHLAEIFPLLGFAGVASVLTEYQDYFLIFSVFMNVAGIIYMTSKLQHACALIEPTEQSEKSCCSTAKPHLIAEQANEKTCCSTSAPKQAIEPAEQNSKTSCCKNKQI